MKRPYRLRAGSLQFVLFIGAVIALLLLSYVLLSHSHLFFHKKTNTLVDLIEGNDKYMLSAINEERTQNALDTSGIERISKKSMWGIFEKYEVVSAFKKTTFKSYALTGKGMEPKAPALYLKDNQRPLIIVGGAKIEGIAALPAQGIRPGNIAGNSYFGSQLVYGKMVLSNTAMPKLPPAIATHIKSLVSTSLASKSQSPFRKGTNYENSFSAPTSYISGDYLELSKTAITGNIVVVAQREIVVRSNAILTDVLLIAPKITVKDNVQGNFQAFATKQIKVGKNCALNYPTALVLQERTVTSNLSQNQKMEPAITLASGSVLKGIVLYQNKSEDRTFFPQVKLESNSTVVGQVYCEKNMELKGQVWGSVYTNGFMALENGSIYQNHLYEGQISMPKLSPQFVGLEFGNSKAPKEIVKWLY